MRLTTILELPEVVFIGTGTNDLDWKMRNLKYEKQLSSPLILNDPLKINQILCFIFPKKLV
jgi:hypothetical protein